MTKITKSESFLQDFFGIFGELCKKHSVYVATAGEVVNRGSILLRNFVLNGQESAVNPLLHIHAKRWQAFEKNEKL